MEGLRFQALDHIEVLNSIHTSKFEKKNSVRFSKPMEVWFGSQKVGLLVLQRCRSFIKLLLANFNYF